MCIPPAVQPAVLIVLRRLAAHNILIARARVGIVAVLQRTVHASPLCTPHAKFLHQLPSVVVCVSVALLEPRELVRVVLAVREARRALRMLLFARWSHLLRPAV